MAPVTIALDVGDRRIGVAISRSGVLAEPLLTVHRRGKKQTLDELEAVVREHGAVRCVIGLPYFTSGDEGPQAEKTREFARSLARRLPGLALAFFDERWTTQDAEEIAGRRSFTNKDTGIVDRIAAAVILRGFLEQEEEQSRIAEQKREPDA